MCLFLPIVFGCPTKVKPDGNEQTAHFCPRCNNASVFSAKSRMWFELFWVPLIPFSSKSIWMCGVCQWTGPLGPGSLLSRTKTSNPQDVCRCKVPHLLVDSSQDINLPMINHRAVILRIKSSFNISSSHGHMDRICILYLCNCFRGSTKLRLRLGICHLIPAFANSSPLVTTSW
ncbi:hypothetical protein BT96DRAFT_207559 [Gymnopus androsaceus JB14]|uniref:Zinc-ribbon 15 domain-containing protein n=1 Tax=Gymnopus androsaceus JB14 TaxID=1447944 RepID=A0A6A4ICD9_9AGAR|nr:hypothetical protein BT96DRAFT_207559 [Gymnopus androsaceus JB14]